MPSLNPVQVGSQQELTAIFASIGNIRKFKLGVRHSSNTLPEQSSVQRVPRGKQFHPLCSLPGLGDLNLGL